MGVMVEGGGHASYDDHYTRHTHTTHILWLPQTLLQFMVDIPGSHANITKDVVEVMKFAGLMTRLDIVTMVTTSLDNLAPIFTAVPVQISCQPSLISVSNSCY